MFHKITIGFCLFFLMGGVARAGGYAGAFLGPSLVSDGYGVRFITGAHAGMKVCPQFGVGLYFSFENLQSSSFGSFAENIGQYIIAVEPNFYPLPDLGLYVGAKLGAGIHYFSYNWAASVSPDQRAPNYTTVNFAGGPAVGYTHQLLPYLGLGAEANVIFAPQTGYNLLYSNLLLDVRYTW